jgi:hypothetical protein
MPRPRSRRLLLAVSLAATLTAPSLAAATPRSRPVAPQASPSPLSTLRNYLLHLWAEIGCTADPNGICTAAAPPPQPRLDTGCTADPNGRCTANPTVAAPQPRLDIGCGADPDGRCTGNH